MLGLARRRGKANNNEIWRRSHTKVTEEQKDTQAAGRGSSFRSIDRTAQLSIYDWMFCIAASPRQPAPPAAQSPACLMCVWIRLIHTHISRFGSDYSENEIMWLDKVTEIKGDRGWTAGGHRWWFWHPWFRHVRHHACGTPRLHDLWKRHTIQTNKSTPLPHNSLSLHLFSSSSCSRLDETSLPLLCLLCSHLSVCSLTVQSAQCL